jgi:nucleotide-binding universal stress UspA family protein
MHALNYAMSVAQEADAHLTVLNVMGDELDVTPDAYGAIIMNDLESLADFRKRHQDEARRRLNEAVPESVAAYCSVETMVLSGGKPSREILRIASEQQTDLIVVGVQGRGAASVMFFGSTTNHVVREATCPVLTIRRP